MQSETLSVHDYKPRPHLEEGLQKVLYMHSRKTKATDEDPWGPAAPKKKRWEECGRNRGPLGSLSYGRSETAETSCLCVWTQRCLPIAPLNYRQVPHIYRTQPCKEKIHNLPCLLLLYIAIYISLWRQCREKKKRMLTASWAWSPAIFSRMWAFNESTGLATVCVPT